MSVRKVSDSPMSTENKKSQRQMFTQAEDANLRRLVCQYGAKHWKLISRLMQTRSTRQCRERYKNYLDPNINRNPWSEEEDALIIQKVAELGPKWSLMSNLFKSRTDVSIKNRYSSLQCKMQLREKFHDNSIKPKKIAKQTEKTEEPNATVKENVVQTIDKLSVNWVSDICSETEAAWASSPENCIESQKFFAGHIW